MGYCRVRNTLDDLRDVRRNLRNPQNKEEREALKDLLDVMSSIMEELYCRYPTESEKQEAKNWIDTFKTDDDDEEDEDEDE